MRIGKLFKFEAAHRLPNPPGKCKNLHGHSYKLEVVVNGEVNFFSGMVIDFDIITGLVNRIIIDNVDHQFLNDIYPNMETTAENLVTKFYSSLVRDIEDGEFSWSIEKLRLWETETCYAEVP